MSLVETLPSKGNTNSYVGILHQEANLDVVLLQVHIPAKVILDGATEGTCCLRGGEQVALPSAITCATEIGQQGVNIFLFSRGFLNVSIFLGTFFRFLFRMSWIIALVGRILRCGGSFFLWWWLIDILFLWWRFCGADSWVPAFLGFVDDGVLKREELSPDGQCVVPV